MKRAKLIAPKKFIIEEVDIPKPALNEVLIKVKACGICGTDLHAYHGEHPFISYPIVPGHEFSGIVEKTGEHVVVEPLLTCGKCYNCKIGRYNICNDLKVIGCQTDGAFAQYITIPINKVFSIPKDMSFEEATFVEPTAVGIHAIKKAGNMKGERIIIMGAGPIGLIVLQLSKIFGAKEIIITDILNSRLKLAKEFGATYAINIREIDLVKWVYDTFGRDGIDKVFECVGGNQNITINQAINLTRKGTKIILIGVFKRSLPIEINLIQDRELEIVGSLVYTSNDFSEAIDLLYKKKINVNRLISKVLPLEKVEDAMKMLVEEKERNIKIILKPNDI
ncbi:MAG: alcohol dehydrogenase catalytic domain-containing protein [Candidatus Methanomethylicaceae archaeon]